MRFPVAKPVVTQDSAPAQWLAPRSQLYYVDNQPGRTPSGEGAAPWRVRNKNVNLPNLITLGRILLVPVIIWAITSGQMAVAFVLFFIAGVSDAVDGFLAKRFDMRSEIGALLDPLADKCLLVSIYVALGITGDVPRWLVILVVSRDIIIIGAVIVSWLVDRPVPMKPLMVSKLNTVAQVVYAGLVLFALGFGFVVTPFDIILMAIVTLLTLLSVSFYLVEWVRHMNTFEPGR
jgi:cardiolipin synthase